jgi:hypothetical protein
MTFDECQSALVKADGLHRSGRWQNALEAYVEIWRSYLSERPADENALVIGERIVDIGVLLRRAGVAETFAGAAKIAGLLQLPLVRATLLLKCIQVYLAASELALADSVWVEVGQCLGALPPYPLTLPGAEAWEAAVRGSSGAAPVHLCQCYLQWGQSQAAQGYYSDALACYERGRFWVSASDDSRASSAGVRLKILQAQGYLETGDLPRCEQILAALDPDPAAHAGLLIRVLELRSRLAWFRGNLGEALTLLESAAEQCHAHQLYAAESNALLNLAELRIALMQTRRARDDIARALNCRPGDSEAQVRAAYLESLAVARGSTQFEREALAPPAFLARAKKDDHREDATLPHRTAISLQADLTQYERDETDILSLLHNGEFQRAERHVRLLREGYAMSESRLLQARLDALQGIVLYYREALEEARALLTNARIEFERMGCLPDLCQSLRFLSLLAKKSGQSGDVLKRMQKEAFEALARMAGSLPPEARAIFLLTKWDETDAQFADRIEELQAIKKRREAAGGLAGLRLQWKLWNKLNTFVDSIYSTRRQLANELPDDTSAGIMPTGVSLLRKLLTHPLNTWTIGYLQLPNKLFYFDLGWMHFDFGELELQRNEVADQLTAFHKDTAKGEEDWGVIDRIGKVIGLVKFLDGLPKWRRVRSLTIVPDGALHYVPFSAIRLDGQYLIERFALSLRFQLQPAAATARTRGGIGLPVALGDTGSKDWRALPNALTEAAEAKAWMDSAGLDGQLLMNNQATVEAVTERLGRARLAWFCCHGKFHPADISQSGIVLYQGRFLDMASLAKLRTPRLEHATLSLCWAGESLVIPGHWVMSFPQLFQGAGCRSVLAPLWYAKDNVARDIATRFIRRAVQYGRREALAMVIRDLMSQDPSFKNDPYLWACFQLYGEPGKLRI